MAEVALFHHALGLTPGVVAFADELRRAGHTVHTPDLFEGRTFGTIDEGMGYALQIGFPGEVIERGARAVEGLPAGLVYAGFSLGVLPAQNLAQTRPGARGALLFYSCVPVSAFGSAWPAGVPAQVHGMDANPVFAGEGDLDAALALVDQADDAELFLYPGDQHYFADSTLPSYDPVATALLTQRVLGFLSAVPPAAALTGYRRLPEADEVSERVKHLAQPFAAEDRLRSPVCCSSSVQALSHHGIHIVDVPVCDRPGDAGACVVVIVDVHGQPGAADLEHRQLLRARRHGIRPKQGPVPRDTGWQIGDEVENVDDRANLLAHGTRLSAGRGWAAGPLGS